MFSHFFCSIALAQGHPDDQAKTVNKTKSGTQITTSSLGTLVIPPNTTGCKTLKLFFPGHAQELGYKGSVPQSEEKVWAKYLLGPGGNYSLKPAIEKSGCPTMILGDSIKTINENEIKGLLKKTGTQSIEVLSHSGGYAGLDASLSNWSPSLISSITTLSMLDNFYRPSLAEKLKSKFGSARLKKICRGFSQDSNSQYKGHYSDFCLPNKVPELDHHKSPVKDYFK